jgi:hypothetical protein
MQFYWFLLGTLALWRVSHLLSFEDGPWRTLERMRQRLGRGVLRSLFDCFYCLTLWVAVPFAFALGETSKARLLLWPALSGAAILLQRITSREQRASDNSVVTYYEDEEERNDVLR